MLCSSFFLCLIWIYINFLYLLCYLFLNSWSQMFIRLPFLWSKLFTSKYLFSFSFSLPYRSYINLISLFFLLFSLFPLLFVNIFSFIDFYFNKCYWLNVQLIELDVFFLYQVVLICLDIWFLFVFQSFFELFLSILLAPKLISLLSFPIQLVLFLFCFQCFWSDLRTIYPGQVKLIRMLSIVSHHAIIIIILPLRKPNFPTVLKLFHILTIIKLNFTFWSFIQTDEYSALHYQKFTQSHLRILRLASQM